MQINCAHISLIIVQHPQCSRCMMVINCIGLFTVSGIFELLKSLISNTIPNTTAKQSSAIYIRHPFEIFLIYIKSWCSQSIRLDKAKNDVCSRWPDPYLFSIWVKQLVRKFSTKKIGTKKYIWLSTAFIVCYKIKHGGFDFHMHSTSLYHPHSALEKKKINSELPYLFYFFILFGWGVGGMSQEPYIFFYLALHLLGHFLYL